MVSCFTGCQPLVAAACSVRVARLIFCKPAVRASICFLLLGDFGSDGILLFGHGSLHGVRRLCSPVLRPWSAVLATFRCSFRNSIQQHRVHRFVAHSVELSPLSSRTTRSGFTFCHFLSDEAKLRSIICLIVSCSGRLPASAPGWLRCCCPSA